MPYSEHAGTAANHNGQGVLYWSFESIAVPISIKLRLAVPLWLR